MPLRVVAAFVVFITISACDRTPSEDIAATVNGRAITYDDLERQYLRSELGTVGDRPSDDQVKSQYLEVLRTLIDSEIMLQRAEREGLLAVDSDVERRFSEMRAPFSEDEFQKQLEERHMTVADWKAQLRRDISAQNLLNKETTAKISITDNDISDFYEANKATFNRLEPQLHLAQILVTPRPDDVTRNLKADNAQDEASARRKIDGLAARIQKGEDFSELAQNYSEDADSASAGGDLGFVTETALEQANADLRRSILALRPGQTTPVVKTDEGYRLLKLITREPAGQRPLNDPTVQQSIRKTLTDRKEQLLRDAFYEVARNEAEVVNYYAQHILAGKPTPVKP
jgi:peptidyl-prolyl cis-trans isomerase SurA